MGVLAMVSRGKYDMPHVAAVERLLLETYDLTLPTLAPPSMTKYLFPFCKVLTNFLRCPTDMTTYVLGSDKIFNLGDLHLTIGTLAVVIQATQVFRKWTIQTCVMYIYPPPPVTLYYPCCNSRRRSLGNGQFKPASCIYPQPVTSPSF